MRRLGIWMLAASAVVCAMLALGTVRGAARFDEQAPAAGEALPSLPRVRPVEEEGADERPACYVGVLVSRGAVDVVARTDGTLQAVNVEVGDAVRRGQELAVIDSPSGAHRLQEQAARLAAVRSSLQSAAVAADRARREMERRQSAPQLFSTEQIEAARFQLEIAELEHERQQAALAEARATHARIASEENGGHLYAPFDGRVSSRHALPGSVLVSGQPILRLVATNRPVVRFAVPASDVDRFAVGARVRAEAVASEAAFVAVVEAVAPVLDEASQLVFIEAGSAGDAWDVVPVGTVLRVGAVDGDSCRDRPVAILPD